MFKVKNKSRYLFFLGLCPGEEKTVEFIDNETRKLHNKGLVSVEQVKRQSLNSLVDKKKKSSNKETVENNKECEVLDTNGWSEN